MGKNFINGSKGDLRRALTKAAKQIEEMTSLLAVLLVREDGELLVHGSEFDLLEPGTRIGIKYDQPTNSYTFSLIRPEEEGEEDSDEQRPSITAADITGASRPVTGASIHSATG